jgi:hypothetical protein
MDESKEPLSSVDVYVEQVDGGDQFLTTGKSWLPTGDTLLSFSDNIN